MIFFRRIDTDTKEIGFHMNQIFPIFYFYYVDGRIDLDSIIHIDDYLSFCSNEGQTEIHKYLVRFAVG